FLMCPMWFKQHISVEPHRAHRSLLMAVELEFPRRPGHLIIKRLSSPLSFHDLLGPGEDNAEKAAGTGLKTDLCEVPRALSVGDNLLPAIPISRYLYVKAARMREDRRLSVPAKAPVNRYRAEMNLCKCYRRRELNLEPHPFLLCDAGRPSFVRERPGWRSRTTLPNVAGMTCRYLPVIGWFKDFRYRCPEFVERVRLIPSCCCLADSCNILRCHQRCLILEIGAHEGCHRSDPFIALVAHRCHNCAGVRLTGDFTCQAVKQRLDKVIGVCLNSR